MRQEFSLDEIAKRCGGKLIGPASSQKARFISTDTRKISPGSIFFALRGPNYDGHQFITEAFQKGASACVIDKEGHLHIKNAEGLPLIVVSDVYRALGNLARSYREDFKIPMIAVTGSAGKTTTKECLRALFSFWKRVRSTSGNLNNHIGLPLNLFELSSDDEMGIFEIGASAVGEIDYLCSILKPTIGVLTCVQPVHLEGFGSLENIYTAKLELGRYLGQTGGTLFVYGDDAHLLKRAKALCPNIITFGRSASCDYVLSHEAQDGNDLTFTVTHERHDYHFRLRGTGLFNIMNAFAALAVADHSGYPLGKSSALWRDFVKVPSRFQFDELSKPQVGIINDCYNANPISFKLALQSFCQIQTKGKRVVIAGDMLELGGKSAQYHQELGREVAKLPINLLIAVGNFSKEIVAGARGGSYHLVAEAFKDKDAAYEFLAPLLRDGDFIFVKGSRGMKLEEIITRLKSSNETFAQIH